MPGAVGQADVKTIYTGGEHNADPSLSLGGAFSDQVLVDDPGLPLPDLLNHLFRNVLGEEEAAGKTIYRCIGYWNTHQDGTAYRCRMKLFKPVFHGGNPEQQSQIYFGWDPAAPGVAPQAIASETTAPTGVSFTQPVGISRLFMPDSPPHLGPGMKKALWIKLVVPIAAEDVAFEYYERTLEWDRVAA